MNNKALAMVFQQVNKPFKANHLSIPSLNAGEVLVKTTYTTICTSDLHTYYGRRPGTLPSILGLEAIGEVADLAPEGIYSYDGERLQLGDRITWAVYAHNPQGLAAQRGFPQKSVGLYKYGHELLSENNTLNGGFATHCLLRNGSTIYKVPGELTPPEAALLNCTHATVAGALRLAGSLRDKNLLVSGAGMLGLSACAMARESRVRRIWVSDLNEERLQQAERFGVDDCLVVTSEDYLNQKIDDEVDIVIETTGAPQAIEQCIDTLSIGGVIILVGSVFPQPNISLSAEQLVRKLLTVRGLHNYIPDDLAAAIRFLRKTRNKYPFHSLVEKEFPLSELHQAFEEGNNSKYYRVGVRMPPLNDKFTS